MSVNENESCFENVLSVRDAYVYRSLHGDDFHWILAFLKTLWNFVARYLHNDSTLSQLQTSATFHSKQFFIGAKSASRRFGSSKWRVSWQMSFQCDLKLKRSHQDADRNIFIPQHQWILEVLCHCLCHRCFVKRTQTHCERTALEHEFPKVTISQPSGFNIRKLWWPFSVNIKFHCIQTLTHLKCNTFKDVWVTQAHLSRQEFEPGMSLWDTDAFILLKSHSQGKLIWFSITWLLWQRSTQWSIISCTVEDIIKGVREWSKVGHGHVDYTRKEEIWEHAVCFLFKYAYYAFSCCFASYILMTVLQNRATLFIFELNTSRSGTQWDRCKHSSLTGLTHWPFPAKW